VLPVVHRFHQQSLFLIDYEELRMRFYNPNSKVSKIMGYVFIFWWFVMVIGGIAILLNGEDGWFIPLGIAAAGYYFYIGEK